MFYKIIDRAFSLFYDQYKKRTEAAPVSLGVVENLVNFSDTNGGQRLDQKPLAVDPF